MKKHVLAILILLALIIAFISGAWYAIRFANVEHDEINGLYILDIFGHSEYWYFECQCRHDFDKIIWEE